MPVLLAFLSCKPWVVEPNGVSLPILTGVVCQATPEVQPGVAEISIFCIY